MTSLAHTLINSKSTSYLRQAPQSAAPMLNEQRAASQANQHNYQTHQPHAKQSVN